MNVNQEYLGRSAVRETAGGGRVLQLQPNLAREPAADP